MLRHMKPDIQSSAGTGGTQSLERAIALLRMVAAGSPDGARLTDLMAGTGLSKATVHRLLAALAREGLVEQDAASRRYFLGPDLDALGQVAAARHRGLPLPGAPVPAVDGVRPSAFLRPEYQGDSIALATLLCDRHARANGTTAALLHESVAGQTTELSFARLSQDSMRLATVLADLGVGKGDRVAVLLPKGPELLIAALATWRLGAVYMPLFTTYTRDAIAFRLTDSQTRAVITNGSLSRKVPRDPARRRAVIMVEGDEALSGVHHDVLFWSALHAAVPRDSVTAYAADDPFALIYTSEAEAPPLGVPLPVKALAGIEQYMRVGLDLRDDDIYWNMADPGWAYGAYYGLIGPLLLGRTTIFCDGPYNVQQGYRMLTKFGVTNLTAAPSQVRAWHSRGSIPVPDKLALRSIAVVGEPLPDDLIEWVTQTLGVPLLDQYGQRETGIVIVNRYAPGTMANRREGSLGRPMPGYRVVVLDREGREAPVGGEGEIAIDTANSPLFWFRSYANDQERTARRFRHGRRYYLTGDWAVLDADGNVHYRGTGSDAIPMQQAG